MRRLTRLVIEKFPNVEPGTTLEFNDGFNVLLGKNATGKTTLLQLLVDIASGRLEELSDEAFTLEYSVRASGKHGVMGDVTIRVESVPGPIESPGERLSGRSRPEQKLRMDFRNAAGTSGQIIVEDEVVVRVAEREIVRQPRRRDRALLDEGQHAWIGKQVGVLGEKLFSEIGAMLLVGRRHLDESLVLFNAITASQVVALSGNAWHIGDMFPDGILQALFKFGSLDPKPPLLQLRSSETPFLQTVADALGVVAVDLDWPLSESRSFGGELAWIYGPPRFRFHVTAGRFFGADKLSYGQKRMLAFLWYMDSGSSFVACDELVNGLHFEWIERCVRDLAGRQAVLTSQNPLLPDYLQFDSPAQVRKTFIRCVRLPDGLFRWQNLDENQSRRFFDAYQVGIEHVSEILRGEELW